MSYFGNETSFVHYDEFNKISQDPCNIQQKNISSEKKLKYITTHIDTLENAKESMNFYGIDIKDTLFVPVNQIDNYSDLLNGNSGNKLSRCNIKSDFGQLPFPTMPSKLGKYGDIDIEDNLGNILHYKDSSCLPRDTNYHNRFFYIFEGIEIPNALKSVEMPENGFDFGNRGISTRFC